MPGFHKLISMHYHVLVALHQGWGTYLLSQAA